MAQLETNTSVESLGYKQELKRSLTFVDLLIYGMVFMVPIAPFGIYGYVAQGSKGMVALAYLIGMVGMIFTALSYARMAEAFPIAGSVYSYAQRGMNMSVLWQGGAFCLIAFSFRLFSILVSDKLFFAQTKEQRLHQSFLVPAYRLYHHRLCVGQS